jgi:plastocyanin
MLARVFKIALGVSVLTLGHATAVLSGEIAGRIVFPPPDSFEASLGTPGILSNPGSEQPADAEAVVVYVAEAAGRLPRQETAGAQVRIARGELTPKLIVVSLGSVVTFTNNDRRAHQMRSRTGPQRFNLGRQVKGTARELRVQETGIIPVECAIHGDMRGQIMALAHAAFSIVDPAGNYTLKGVPPGLATVVAYSPRLGEISREVVVPESGAVEVEFAF